MTLLIFILLPCLAGFIALRIYAKTKTQRYVLNICIRLSILFLFLMTAGIFLNTVLRACDFSAMGAAP